MRPQGPWQGRHPYLWGATEFYLGDIIVLDLAFLLDQRDGRCSILGNASVDINEAVFMLSLTI